MDHENWTNVADRLEWVRSEVAKNMSLKDFHSELREKVGLTASYAAARRYHQGARKTPTTYLAAVGTTWGISVGWLATGEGWPFDTPAIAKQLAHLDSVKGSAARARAHLATLDERRGVLSEHLELTAPMSQGLEDVLVREMEPVLLRYAAKAGHDSEESGRRVAKAFEAPLEALGLDIGRASPYRRRAYFSLMAAALETMLIDASDVTLDPAWKLSQQQQPQQEEGNGEA